MYCWFHNECKQLKCPLFVSLIKKVYFWVNIVILGRESMNDGAELLDEVFDNVLHL